MFTICHPSTICPNCGAFCHSPLTSRPSTTLLPRSGHGDAILRHVIGPSKLDNMDNLNQGFKTLNVPFRLEAIRIAECEVIRCGQMPKSQADRRMREVARCCFIDEQSPYYDRLEQECSPIVCAHLIDMGREEIIDENEMVYEQTGTTSEAYQEPVYTEVTKTRDEEYEETISKTQLTTVMRPVEKRMKKIEYTPVYDTWAHKWVQREDVSYYNETVTDWKWENVPYTEKVKKTRSVPYTEKVQTGTRTAYRDVPVYDHVEKTVAKSYYRPKIAECLIYLVPIRSCILCQCPFCVGDLFETADAKCDGLTQWRNQLQMPVKRDACLVCGKRHELHYIPNGVSKLKGVRAVYDPSCDKLYGQKSGQIGRMAVTVVDPRYHGCQCFVCLRRSSTSWFKRIFSNETELNVTDVECLRRELQLAYPVLTFQGDIGRIRVGPAKARDCWCSSDGYDSINS